MKKTLLTKFLFSLSVQIKLKLYLTSGLVPWYLFFQANMITPPHPVATSPELWEDVI